MKIIKKGSLKGKKYRHTCDKCETIFEFFEKEAKFDSSPKNEAYLKIKCPVCKKECYIDY